MPSKEIWFKHREALLGVGMPVHWKGWLVSLVFGGVLLSVVFVFNATRGSLSGEELLMLYAGFGGAVLLLTVAFAFMAWPHREKPNGRR